MADFEPDMLLTLEEQERVREGQRIADLLRADPELPPTVAVNERQAA